MSNGTEDNFNIEALKAILYGETFGPITQQTGRYLLVVATLTLMVRVFDVGVKSTPLLPLDFSKHPDTLLVFLAMATLALLGAYLLRITSDLVRASEEWAEARKQIELEKIRRAESAARDLERAILEADPSRDRGPVDHWWEEYEELASESLGKIRRLEKRIADRRGPILMRWVRLVSYAGLPLVVSILALAHTWRGILVFVQAVVGISSSS